MALEPAAELALEAARCPGCDATEAHLEYAAHDALYAVDSRPFPLQRCAGCGLVYLGVRPTREAIARAYPAHYFWRLAHTESAPGADLDARFAALYFRQLYARRARWAARRLPPGPARVLDLGCGEGHFLRALAAERAAPEDAVARSDAFQGRGGSPPLAASGLDAKTPSWTSDGSTYVGVDFAVGPAAAPLRLLSGDLNGLALDRPPLEGARFDLVCFWHVLEHLHAPRAALRTAYEALRPGGTLLVATQNFDALSRRLMGPRWPLNDVPRHLCHFTPGTLSPLLVAAGFEAPALHRWTEYFPVFGGHLLPSWTVRPDGALRALPGLTLCALGLPVELVATALGAGCTFNMSARKPR